MFITIKKFTLMLTVLNKENDLENIQITEAHLIQIA